MKKYAILVSGIIPWVIYLASLIDTLFAFTVGISIFVGVFTYLLKQNKWSSIGFALSCYLVYGLSFLETNIAYALAFSIYMVWNAINLFPEDKK